MYVFACVCRLDAKLRERLEKEHIPLQHLPGRPVGWRGKVVEVLEHSVQRRCGSAEDLQDAIHDAKMLILVIDSHCSLLPW